MFAPDHPALRLRFVALEEGGVNADFEPPACARSRRRRRSARAWACAAAATIAIFIAWYACRKASVSFARVMLGTHGGVCTTVAEASMMLGLPAWAANAALMPVVVLPDAALWAPREVARDGLQRSNEQSALCGGTDRIRTRAATLTVEYGHALGWLRRRVRRTFVGVQAACVQHAMELIRDGRVCLTEESGFKTTTQ